MRKSPTLLHDEPINVTLHIVPSVKTFYVKTTSISNVKLRLVIRIYLNLELPIRSWR